MRAVDRRVALLLQNLRHPSLRAKKYDEARDLWQARATGSWRFYFQIEGDAYHLIELMHQPKKKSLVHQREIRADSPRRSDAFAQKHGRPSARGAFRI